MTSTKSAKSATFSSKGFLMTLAATTISIILTFGTTAIIDHKKQKAEKREMVMMIMYDMRESLKTIEQCDQDLKSFFDVQVDVIAHPEKFAESYPDLARYYPMLDYTSTTESIFRSNIETIQTLGNFLFVEAVSSFYDGREKYRKDVMELFSNESINVLSDFERLRDFNSASFPYYSELILCALQRDYEQCKSLMKVTDEELEVYSLRKEELVKASSETTIETISKATRELQQRKSQFQKAREDGTKNR